MKLKQLTVQDGREVYEMLQRIGRDENAFSNIVNGMSYEDYKKWLIQQDEWSRDSCLQEGYVGQTTYWLMDGPVPVGYGKIRHQLTEKLRQAGGNVGYAIDPLYRGKGYGTCLMRELVKTAGERGIKEILATVEKNNYPSKKAIEKCGGKLIDENDSRWFFEL